MYQNSSTKIALPALQALENSAAFIILLQSLMERFPIGTLDLPLTPWPKDLNYLAFVLFSGFFSTCKTCLTSPVITVLKPF